MRAPTAAGWIKPALFLLCLVPAVDLAHGAWTNTLGVNPLETLTHSTGTWALRFLLLTLLVTPLIRILKAPALLRYRRMLGLFAFFYALVHLGTYLWFDKFFEWQEIWLDIQDRLFITAGMTAFVLLVPLALTSTRRIQRALGNAWNRLHRLIYVAATAGLLHYFWLVKADYLEPIIYASIFAALMLARIRKGATVSAPGVFSKESRAPD